MKPWSVRAISKEAQLLLIGIPVLLWTLIPVYHLFLFAISERDTATSGRLWPKNATLQNFETVFQQKHFYLNHFWVQLGNSLMIAVAVGAITLFVATTAAFAISRLKVRGGHAVMNLALFTYFIPAAFLAVPMYKTMGNYGLLNSQWALILSMIWTLGDFNSVYLLTGGGPADLTHVLATLGIRYLRLDQVDLSMASVVVALPLVLPLVYFMMKRLSK